MTRSVNSIRANKSLSRSVKTNKQIKEILKSFETEGFHKVVHTCQTRSMPRKDTGKRKAHLETLCKEMEAVGDYHVTCLNRKEIFLIQIFLAKVKVTQEC